MVCDIDVGYISDSVQCMYMYHSFISDRFYETADPLVFWQGRNLLLCISMTSVACDPRQTVECKRLTYLKQFMSFIGLFTSDYTYQMLHNELY